MAAGSPDTIVIGAGIIGASIAWKLALAGRRVTLVDAGAMGGEASWAGAGMLAPGGEVESRDAWTSLALESLDLYPEYVAELEETTGVEVDYRRCGAVEVAFDHEDWQALRRRAAVQREMGIASATLDAADVRVRIPSFNREIAGALFYPDDAIVDPRSVMAALRIGCCAQGVALREGWRATGVRLSTNSVEVDSATGTLRAATAVLAAGAWSSEIVIAGGAGPGIPPAFPVRGHLIGYQLEPDSLGPILRQGHTYMLQRAGGLTVAGTSSEHAGFERRIDPQIVSDIVARVSDLLPFLRGKRHSTSWIGFRPGADSPGPVIQRMAGANLWLAYGHYRNGILLAPVTANILSREISAS